jgi:hypothetical protein
VEYENQNEANPGLAEHECQGSALRHVRTFTPYKTKQKTFAGIKPHCAVWSPMMQTTTLFMAASAHPSQQRRPIKIVDTMVRTQDT